LLSTIAFFPLLLVLSILPDLGNLEILSSDFRFRKSSKVGRESGLQISPTTVAKFCCAWENLRTTVTTVCHVIRHLWLSSASASPAQLMRAQWFGLFVYSNFYLFTANFICLQQLLFVCSNFYLFAAVPCGPL
jgi:hypothetical protein